MTAPKIKKPYRYPGGLETTDPALGKCGKCRRPVLVCHVDGMPVKADPTALTLKGQIEAREADRHLYEVEISTSGRSAFLRYRDEARILLMKPHIAITDHDCQSPLHEFTDEAGQTRLDSWLYPAHPARSECVFPPF